MPGYRGKVAVVTGAASGIGYAVAARAAAEGMTVVLADIDTGKLRDAAAALRGTGRLVWARPGRHRNATTRRWTT